MDPRDQGFPDHPFDAAALDDDDPPRFNLGIYKACMAHLERKDDGPCLGCRETIPRGASFFVDGDRLCADCASDRKVTP